MTHMPTCSKDHRLRPAGSVLLAIVVLVIVSLSARAQTCQTRDEMPPGAKADVDAAAQLAFDQARRGDLGALRASAIASLQAKFDAIAAAAADHRAALAGSTAQVRASFLIDTGNNIVPDGRFLCGVFGASGLASGSAEFLIPGLPVGKYAIVIQDVTGPKGPYALTVILQDVAGWKLAGFYIRPETAAGHDGLWFMSRARDYKARSQNHNAWFYYLTSWQLLAPVTFIDTNLLAKITQESSAVQPKDIPLGSNSTTFTANGKSYTLIDTSVSHTDSSVDLSIKYVVNSAKDFNATLADARAMASAYAAQYPELKDAFNNLIAHAVDSDGNDVPGMVNLKPAKP